MRRTTLAVLLGLTIALGLVGAWLVVDRVRETSADLSGRPLMPELKYRLNDVASVTIEGAEGAFTLKRGGTDRWVMPERGNYPVDFGKLQRLLVALGDMVAIEPKTARPDRYHFLDVEDVAPGTRGLRLTVKDRSNLVLADLIVGRPDDVLGASKVPRFFVRPVGEAGSWEVEADLRPARTPADWLDRELLVLAPDRFAAVTVTKGDETARISRTRPDGSFTLDGLDTATMTAKMGRIGALAVATTYLTFEDVRKVKDGPAGQPLATVRFETFDGLVLTLGLVTIDGQGWTTIEAAYEAPTAPVEAGPGPDGQPVLKDAESVRAEVGAINARTKGWLYRLDGTRVIDLTPTPGDLADVKPAPAPVPEPVPVPEAAEPPAPQLP